MGCKYNRSSVLFRRLPVLLYLSISINLINGNNLLNNYDANIDLGTLDSWGRSIKTNKWKLVKTVDCSKTCASRTRWHFKVIIRSWRELQKIENWYHILQLLNSNQNNFQKSLKICIFYILLVYLWNMSISVDLLK